MTLSIILVRPQMGENIGAAARAMANFAVRDLRLVAPRDGWPNPKASDMAGKALDIVDDAKLYDSTADAIADCQFVLATTARARSMNLPVLDAREAMQQLHARATRGEKVAVLFGPERTGLENEEVVLADAVVTIPVSEEYASLNLGQAVVVLCYEYLMAGNVPPTSGGRLGGGLQETPSPTSPHPNPPPEGEGIATRATLAGLFDHLESALDEVNFWRVPEKREVMWRNIRAVLIRAQMTAQEIATWRGIVKALKG